MAEIYLAIAEKNDASRQFAIKVIHQQNADDPDFVRMLVDEARLAVQLKHANIVCTYDLGLENDQYYIVMELVEGADLFRLQQRAADQRLSFPIPLAAYIAREVARGLDYAHRLRDSDGQPLQVVHRDISPQNVLIGYDGTVKITDFGIAKAARRAAQTQAGIIKGKYYYMSPEQASGQFIDGRTDIFAAGILLYEMLIGEMLYYDDDVDRLLQTVRKADIPPVSQRRSDTPPALERILMKALRKSPSERYQTAGEYSQALDTYLRRYAPTFSASDVGAFLDRLVGDKVRRRALHEPTASMAAPTHDHDGNFGVPGGDQTVGLTAEQVRQIGVRDENSLIFRPKEALAALLQAGGAQAELPSSSIGTESAPGRDEEALIKTTQRQMEGSQVVAKRSSSSGTMEVMVPGMRGSPGPPVSASRGYDSDEVTADVPEQEADAAPRPGAPAASKPPQVPKPPAPPSGEESRRPARPTLRSHSFSRPPREETPREPSEVFKAIVPELEEELMAGSSSFAPQPYILTGQRRVFSSWNKHEPLSSQASNGEVTVPRAEVPPELLAALKPGADERAGSGKAEAAVSPQAPPPARAPGPVEPSSKVELLQSDLAFSDPSVMPVEPNFELSQSDVNFAESSDSVSAAKPVPMVHVGVNQPSAGSLPTTLGISDPALDAISAESTHHNLAPAARRPAMDDGPTQYQAGPPEPAPAPPPPPAPQRLWPYWLSGISAALLSAGLTWYLTGPGAHRGGRTAGAGDMLPGALATATLILPEGVVSETEPPPAGESLAPAVPTPSPVPKAGDGELVVNTQPDGAEVYIDKKLVGQTPLTLRDLATNQDFRIDLKLAGYAHAHKRIKWRGKTAVQVSIKLRPGKGKGDDEDSSESGSKGGDSKSGSDPSSSGSGETKTGTPAGEN